MPKLLRIAHISDLHFSSVSLSLNQFFSKRWIGNLNLIAKRRSSFDPSQVEELIDFFKSQHINVLIITGDLTTTSRSKEFQKAKTFIHKIENEGIQVFVIPGNHDRYTKSACNERRFYKFFPSHYNDHSPFNLKEHRITTQKLAQGWWLVLLDTALATSLFSSRGCFSGVIQKYLETTLSTIPANENVILANHFPFFSHEPPRKKLVHGDALKKLLKKHPNIRFYLHGHTHAHTLADLRTNHLPIILDSGSCAHRKHGSFNIIDLTKKGANIHVYKRFNNEWLPSQHISYDLVRKRS